MLYGWIFVSALTEVYQKANSTKSTKVEAPAWIHKYIIGRKGSNIKEITQNLPKVHVEFTDKEDKIKIEGPPEEVETALEQIQAITQDLLKKLTFEELTVDPKYYKHIIGKNGANGKFKLVNFFWIAISCLCLH